MQLNQISGPVPIALFLYKNREQKLHFCHTHLHEKATKTLQYSIMTFQKLEKSERTEADLFDSVFVIRWINGTSKNGCFSPVFEQKWSSVNRQLRCIEPKLSTILQKTIKIDVELSLS